MAGSIGRACRSVKADVQDEVPDFEVKLSASGPVHDQRQQDDRQDDDDHPEEEHDDAGDRMTGNGCGSSHGHQLPAFARLIHFPEPVNLLPPERNREA